MFLPSEGKIDAGRLSRIYDNTTATYKFYWFVSIIDLICSNSGRRRFSFDEIIAGMIAEAWYPIHYFRLSFGKMDSLETNILAIQRYLNIPIDASRDAVRNKILQNVDDPAVHKLLHVFTLNVPYRFLSPWIPKSTDSQVVEHSISYMNSCPYAIHGQTIVVDEMWVDYLIKNAVILKDFSFWNLSIFLQKRNPNVPDIPSKLIRPLQRSPLTQQHRFWNRYIESVGHIHCIYTGAELEVGSYDLDHFIPWSFVVHDLLWNLLPSDSSVNSSKSNCIPSLDKYLEPMTKLQHAALRANFSSNPSDKLFEDYLVFRCSIPELIDASDERFYGLFKNEFAPMAQTATNMGFAPWINVPAYE
ncbi:MAG: HNH endonuclease [Bacteroidales bacterium]|nr:HNH endonuclease [Bacteroidales bacterium]MBR6865021.1 HNH endonuclease [Bacteroidales bacterium]